MGMDELLENRERYVMVAVSAGNEENAEESLRELKELARTANAEVVCRLIQNLPHPDPATYVGSGKVKEISLLLEEMDADGIICDDELTPAQMKNLSDTLNCKVIDRTILILDIFAGHAHSNEGKLQVEMAQLKYRASHLAGWGKALSRLGGGIGTRGPGETKLETDRRTIEHRISVLSAQMKRMMESRNTARKQRMRNRMPVAALVGQTNAGKSTLLNHLTGSSVKSEDLLFATLDPTTRSCLLPDGQ
ncbi:MAG: GTPase HflX, partial [Lachnospiraceae bacterium]|nr:GTPase HflX [Lachnospiraceae bacterium]